MIADLICTISTPAGPLSLNAFPYRLEKDTRNTRQVSKRKSEAANPFVEGTYQVASVRENVTEALNVYVQDVTDSATFDAVQALTDALDQITYTITFSRNGLTETWACFSADYQIGTQHEFQHAGLAVVRATVPRLPAVTKAS